MNVSVILGHPYDGSFNAAIAQTVVQTLEEDGHAVAFHDLHAEGFNPVIPPSELVSDVPADDLTALHQREIKEADGIVVVHPNWWGQPPAILKGWVDRVLREGVAYGFAEGDSGGGLPIGLLKAARCSCSTRRTRRKRASSKLSAIRCSGCGATASATSAA